MTAPTCRRGQVPRDFTRWGMSRKYWSTLGRSPSTPAHRRRALSRLAARARGLRGGRGRGEDVDGEVVGASEGEGGVREEADSPLAVGRPVDAQGCRAARSE